MNNVVYNGVVLCPNLSPKGWDKVGTTEKGRDTKKRNPRKDSPKTRSKGVEFKRRFPPVDLIYLNIFERHVPPTE